MQSQKAAQISGRIASQRRLSDMTQSVPGMMLEIPWLQLTLVLCSSEQDEALSKHRSTCLSRVFVLQPVCSVLACSMWTCELIKDSLCSAKGGLQLLETIIKW